MRFLAAFGDEPESSGYSMNTNSQGAMLRKNKDRVASEVRQGVGEIVISERGRAVHVPLSAARKLLHLLELQPAEQSTDNNAQVRNLTAEVSRLSREVALARGEAEPDRRPRRMLTRDEARQRRLDSWDEPGALDMSGSVDPKGELVELTRAPGTQSQPPGSAAGCLGG